MRDDAELRVRNDDLADCEYEGQRAGTDGLTVDGVRIAGWYVPAANGAGPTAPTVVLVHGFDAYKSGGVVIGLRGHGSTRSH